MTEDILPPTPPGKKQPVAKEKKKGFLSSLFGAKKEKPIEFTPSYEPRPEPEEEPQKTIPKIPQDIDLNDIRQQLGLEPADMMTEEPKPSEASGTSKEFFELPDIEEPAQADKEEKPPVLEEDILEEDIIEEPPKILPKNKPGKKPKNETVAKLSNVNWASEVGEKRPAKQKSDFLEDLEPEELKAGKPVSDDFIAEVHPEDVKKLAKNIKRKKFEQDKGIQYEPEVSLENEAEESLENEPEEKEDFLIDASPEEEIENIKKKLRGELTEKKPGPIAEKKAEPEKKHEPEPQIKLQPEKKEEPEAEEPPMLPDESLLLKEEFPRPSEEPPMLLQEKPGAVSKSLIEIEADFREKITEKIREEEKAKAKAELEEAKKALEKDKQLLEQEKILVAGKTNKYDFKEKQLRKEKSDLAAEKEKFAKEKEEAGEMMKKLPQMRKDHERLHQRMNEIYENLKKYNNREDELHKIEQTIEEKEKILEQAQKRLEETEERIKEKGFSDYLETELKEEPLVSPQFEEKDISKVSNLDIYNLVDNCKAMIIDKNFQEAKKAYMQLRDTYPSIKMESEEKNVLYAAIRELYDDIKLSEMENAGL